MKLLQTLTHVAAALAGLALVAVATAAEGEQITLVRIGNAEAITARDLSEYLDRRVDLRPARRNAWGVQMILREMALTRALGLEGDALHVPRLADREKERFDDIYANVLYKKLAKTCAPLPDAAAARKFFDENPQEFRAPPMARLSRVMLPTMEIIDGEPAMGWLVQQAQEIALGAQKIEDVAKRAEDVYRLDVQGDLGWVALNDDEMILRALSSAKQGELVGPVREGDFGYLFFIAAKRESRQLAWEEVATSVPTQAANLCRQEANEELSDRLFKKYGVEIDQKAIDQLFSIEARKPKSESAK